MTAPTIYGDVTTVVDRRKREILAWLHRETAGEFVTASKIADQIGHSHRLVTEALVLLEDEGLVHRVGRHRGCRWAAVVAP